MSDTLDERSAAELHAAALTDLAWRREDPGVRAFFLQWAKAFREVAALGRPEEKQDPD